MTRRTLKILLWLQVFYVFFGIALYYGLKELRLAHKEDVALRCEFEHLIGEPADEEYLQKTGRPYIIVPPGFNLRMDSDPTRINVHVDDGDTVVAVRCG